VGRDLRAVYLDGLDPASAVIAQLELGVALIVPANEKIPIVVVLEAGDSVSNRLRKDHINSVDPCHYHARGLARQTVQLFGGGGARHWESN